MHTEGFKDYMLKPEILRAIVDNAFEHPSEVQAAAIPHAMLGVDLLAQGRSGMGKTAVFVLTTLHGMQNKDDVQVLVLCHTRELAYQIGEEYKRFSKYLPGIKTLVVFGGGTIDQLSSEATNAKATGVWVQDASGNFQLFVIGGPAFLNDQFRGKFTSGLGVASVLLVK